MRGDPPFRVGERRLTRPPGSWPRRRRPAPASHSVGSRVPRDRGRAGYPPAKGRPRSGCASRGARPSRHCAGIVDSGGTRSCASAIREGHAPSWPYASWFCNCQFRGGDCKTSRAFGRDGTPCRPRRSRGDRPTGFCNYLTLKHTRNRRIPFRVFRVFRGFAITSSK